MASYKYMQKLQLITKSSTSIHVTSELTLPLIDVHVGLCLSVMHIDRE